MTLEEIIKNKESNLSKIPDKLLTDIQKAEKGIYGKVVTLLNRLKKDSDGNLIISKYNIAISSEIVNELKTIVLTKDYLDSLREFINGMDEQALANDAYFAKIFDNFKISATADAVLERAKTAALDQLLGAPMEAEFVKPMADIIDTAISSGSSFTDLSNQIKDFVLGTPEVDGKLASYSSQVSYDSFAFADRAYTNIIAEEMGAEWYVWNGRLLETSRPFCEDRKGKYFHYKEIEAMADLEWQGKAEGTNAQTIFIVAGGYRCIDSILPVSISVVPNDVVQRNIDNGNYEVT